MSSGAPPQQQAEAAMARWWWDATIRASALRAPPCQIPTAVLGYHHPSAANDPGVWAYAQTPGPCVADVLGAMSLSRLSRHCDR